jgi:hypothetical protein
LDVTAADLLQRASVGKSVAATMWLLFRRQFLT